MKDWNEIYCEVLTEIQSEVKSGQSELCSADVSVELSRRLFDRYEPVELEGRLVYRFKP